MNKHVYWVVSLMLVAVLSVAAQGPTGVVEGSVKKIDTTAKTVVVKAADGTEHTFHVADHTAVHGTEAAAKSTKSTLHGLKEGNEVVVHYVGKGTEKTADEIDNVGKDGLKAGEGTIKAFDRDTKTLTIKSAAGVEDTFRLSESAARDAGKDLGKGSEKSGKVVVYYTEEAGHKVAHFFKKAI